MFHEVALHPSTFKKTHFDKSPTVRDLAVNIRSSVLLSSNATITQFSFIDLDVSYNSSISRGGISPQVHLTDTLSFIYSFIDSFIRSLRILVLSEGISVDDVDGDDRSRYGRGTGSCNVAK